MNPVGLIQSSNQIPDKKENHNPKIHRIHFSFLNFFRWSEIHAKVEKPVLNIQLNEYETYNCKTRTIQTIKFTMPIRKEWELAFKQKIKDINVIVQDKFFTRLNILPENVGFKLLEFFSIDRPTENFNCFDFINFVFGFYRKDQGLSLQINKWSLKLLEIDSLGLGRAICLAKEIGSEAKFVYKKEYYVCQSNCYELILHYALCIGSDLFLSVLGKGGPLIVTNLNSIKILYNADKIYEIFPATVDK